jgi:amidohydrolase
MAWRRRGRPNLIPVCQGQPSTLILRWVGRCYRVACFQSPTHLIDALAGLGHACGHNLIAVVSVAAALATSGTLRQYGLPGKILLIGTPAEEGGGGKIRCLAAGAYEGVDFSMISHPGIANNSALVCTTAFTRLRVRYTGRAAHAAQQPWRGVNALDALVVAYTAISALRQQTQPGDVIGLHITEGGDGGTNIIHAHAAGVAVLRAARAHRLHELQRKVEGCFRAGAEATGASVAIDVDRGYLDHVPNQVLAARYAKHWAALLPVDDLPNPLLRTDGPTWIKSSTDQGNISYVLPSINVSFAIPPGPVGGAPHSPDFQLAAGTRGAFAGAMRVAKAMAGAAADVFTTPGLLDAVRVQWRRDMGKD